MPTLLTPKTRLFSLLGTEFTDEQFEELCFSFGIELDEITSDRSIFEKEHSTSESVTNSESYSEEILYRIEIPANRYDLLSVEGLSMALKAFIRSTTFPDFKILKNSQVTVHVLPNAFQVRPYFFSAILNNITFDSYSYDSFIKYQDKLHQTIGRNRSIVAIGTHDLDTIKPPIFYNAVPPEEIAFIPLNQTKIVKGTELFKFYESDLKLKKFLPLLEGKPYYPLITDSEGTVCSLPPLINGDKSKITLNTKNVFIDITCMDATKGEAALKSIVTGFSLYCQDKFTISPVEVKYPNANTGSFGKSEWNLVNHVPISYRVTLFEVSKHLKVSISKDLLIECLEKMMYSFEVLDDLPSGDSIFTVFVPLNRTDILHKCDVIEDIAIAYGFQNIPMSLPTSFTIAAPSKMNKFSDMLRYEMAFSGFTEVLTLTLCSIDDLVLFLNKDKSTLDEIVTIGNPKSIETQAVRNTLLSGLLKTLASNKAVSLPILLFEVSDVLLKSSIINDLSDSTGAKNERRLAAIYAGPTSGFEVIHSGLDRIMAMLSVTRVYGSSSNEETYFLSGSSSPTYLEGRYASILHGDQKIGEIGVVHPTVLEYFGIPHAVSFFEISLDSFL